jgi:hypothetical protein
VGVISSFFIWFWAPENMVLGRHGGVLKVQWVGHLEFHKMEESFGCESSSWKKTTVSWNFFALCFAYGLWILCWLWNKLVFLSRVQIKMTSSSCCASKVYNLLEGCVKGIEQL